MIRLLRHPFLALNAAYGWALLSALVIVALSFRWSITLFDEQSDVIFFGAAHNDLLRSVLMPALQSVLIVSAHVLDGRWLEVLSPRRMFGWVILRVVVFLLLDTVATLLAFGARPDAVLVCVRNVLVFLLLAAFFIAAGRAELAWLPIVALTALSLFAGGDPDRDSWSPLFAGIRPVPFATTVILGIVPFAIAPLFSPARMNAQP